MLIVADAKPVNAASIRACLSVEISSSSWAMRCIIFFFYVTVIAETLVVENSLQSFTYIIWTVKQSADAVSVLDGVKQALRRVQLRQLRNLDLRMWLGTIRLRLVRRGLLLSPSMYIQLYRLACFASRAVSRRILVLPIQNGWNLRTN